MKAHPVSEIFPLMTEEELKKIKVHPAAEIFPMMTEEELNLLAEDIKANGLMTPIIVDDDNVLIDGRNRLAACNIAEVKPKFSKLNGHDPLALILSSNIARRHMNKGQQAMVVAMMYPEAKVGGDRQSAKGKAGSKIEPAFPVHKGALSQARAVLHAAPIKAAEVLAGASLVEAFKEVKELGKGPSFEERLAALRARHPDLADKVIDDGFDLKKAEEIANARDEERRLLEENKREGLYRICREAYTSIKCWASSDFLSDLDERLADDGFHNPLIERMRFDPKTLNEVKRGAEAFIEFATKLGKKRKSHG